MKILPVLAMILCAAVTEIATPSKAEFESACRARPELRKPGVNENITLAGTQWCVFCGEAERLFAEGESDEELYDEAESQAKFDFFQYWRKKTGAQKVTLEGARRIAQYSETNHYYVVMCVPQSGIVETKVNTEKEKSVRTETL